MCKLSPVAFHGDTIFCIDYHGEPYVPMKPIVENLGLNWSGQAAKFRENKKRWGVEMISTPTESGVQEMLCLPLRKLAAWFASINPKKVRQELRAKIELYQAESDDALWNYWITGRAERKTRQEAIPAHKNKFEAYLEKKERPRQKALPGGAKNWIGITEYAAKIDRLVLETQQKSNEFMKAVADLGYALLFRPACLDDEVTDFGKELGHYLHGLGFAAQTTAKSMCEMAEVYRGQLKKRE